MKAFGCIANLPSPFFCVLNNTLSENYFSEMILLKIFNLKKTAFIFYNHKQLTRPVLLQYEVVGYI